MGIHLQLRFVGNGLRVAVGAWLGDVGAVDFHSVAGSFALANGATVVRVACSAFASLAKRDKHWAGAMGLMCRRCAWRMLLLMLQLSALLVTGF